MQKLIPLVVAIKDSLEQAKGVRFCGSSLIFAYCSETGSVNCKLVDFQNVSFTNDEQVDNDVIFGLSKLLDELTKL